ncbi:hypothetical protein Trydic_g9316 [Trypoxylus dichotomus]
MVTSCTRTTDDNRPWGDCYAMRKQPFRLPFALIPPMPHLMSFFTSTSRVNTFTAPFRAFTRRPKTLYYLESGKRRKYRSRNSRITTAHVAHVVVIAVDPFVGRGLPFCVGSLASILSSFYVREQGRLSKIEIT